ncbi:O-antigen ligase [Bacillus sp. Marseille-Q3570]|uniref:O-antigen ligase family protein n=1 Tax=Bacillus sp. Marseille-Q3570 TaxID=2963522 RepID=UPI0021B83F86|nr:O-antigen ligase family protein [Bacillus sp. Marseille-Q3570]
MNITAQQFIKKYLLEIGLLLCFILPPIGVIMLLIIGIWELHQTWRYGKFARLTTGLFLFGCLFVSSIGASIVMDDQSYFLVSSLILAYFGIYMKITKEGVKKTFTTYKWIMIFGGVYFYCLYPFQGRLIFPSLQNYIYGTVLVGDASLQDYKRLIGAAYNPNFSVTILLLGLAFLLAECLNNLKKGAYFLAGSQIVITWIFIHAILLTGSKAGFSTMVVIFILFLFRLKKGFTFILILIMSMNVNWLLQWMPRNEHILQSIETRMGIWKNSFYLWKEQSLFGMTSLGFKEEYSYHFNEKIPHAHNMVLAMFTEFGTLGGMAFLIVVIINVYKVLYLYFTEQKNKYLDAFLLSLPVILLTGVFDYVLFSPQVTVMTIILLAFWDKYTARLSFWSPRLLLSLKWSYPFSHRKRDY